MISFVIDGGAKLLSLPDRFVPICDSNPPVRLHTSSVFHLASVQTKLVATKPGGRPAPRIVSKLFALRSKNCTRIDSMGANVRICCSTLASDSGSSADATACSQLLSNAFEISSSVIGPELGMRLFGAWQADIRNHQMKRTSIIKHGQAVKYNG